VRSDRLARRWWLGLTMALAALALAACGDEPQSAMDPQGPFAQKPDDLWQIVFVIAIVVFVIVQGLIVFTVFKFRERPDDTSLPVQTHGNTRLEIMWTVIPALILAGIAVPTVRTIFELDAEPDGAMTVQVIGHRWWWEYRYPGAGPDGQDIVTANEMVIPVGQPVRLEMTAQEAGGPDNAVIHSFWIPKLAGKQDVVPGRITTLNIQADSEGRYLGQCAEYCGLSHANMRARVDALSDDQFQRWLADQAEPAAEPEGELARQGKELFFREGSSCVGCHALNAGDLSSGAQVGPNLTHLMSRQEFAGAIFELNEDNLTAWLENPSSMKPMRPDFGVGMPDLFDESDPEARREIQALVAYLLSLL